MFKRQFLNTIGKRLASTLALVENQGKEIAPSSLSALKAAKLLGNPVIAFLCGSDASKATETARKLEDVDKVYINLNKEFDNYNSEKLSAALAHTIKSNDISHLVAASSTVGKDIIPRVGGILSIQPISDVTKIVSANEFTRPIYAGNAFETVKSSQPINLITFRASSFEASQPIPDKSVDIEECSSPEFKNPSSVFVSENLVSSGRPELDSAKVVVSGGRGLKTKEDFERLVYPLADKLNAAVGASRAVVDDNFCDNSLQIGQTGKVVAPELYIALGISGAIQHLAGMKDSKVIAAVDKNAEASIFQVADIGLEGDLFDVVPQLIEKL